MAKDTKKSGERYDVVKKVEGDFPYEVLEPKNIIKEKVGDAKGISIKAIHKAEMAVKELGHNYINDFVYDAEALKKAFENFIKAKGAQDRATHLKETTWAAHEIKGQGGSFGYPFVSAVSKSFCDYLFELEERKLFDELATEIMRAHVNTLVVIGKRRIRGDGGETGQLVCEGLVVATRKHLAQDESFLKSDVLSYLKKLQEHMEDDPL